MKSIPSASYSVTMRVSLEDKPGTFARVAGAIGKAGGSLGAVDLVSADGGHKIRDLSVLCADEEQSRLVIAAVKQLRGVKLLSASDRTFLIHLGGKLDISSRVPVKTRDDLSMVYTPGVGRVSMALHEDPAKAWNLTIKGHTVAVVSDGTAVLGLGDIGPYGAMPVMEGKAVLFKAFAGLDAFPVCLDTKDPKAIIETVVRIAPAFGGINLEDISSPRCFEIEQALIERLDIPVMHDDQHGTAVVTTAALLNAARLLKRPVASFRTVISGAGASAVTVARMLKAAGVKDIICCDRAGAIYAGRPENMNPVKERLAAETNPRRYEGDIGGALQGANLFIGLSTPGAVRVSELKRMAKDPLIFAMANPTPEVQPEQVASFARVVATGRSDYPNQINNALAFPGIFKGALEVRARRIDERMKMAAARAIASVVSDAELSEDYIIPSIFNPKVVERVSAAVMRAAYESGLARRRRVPLNGDG